MKASPTSLTLLYTSIAMMAFAANSVLCRLALNETDIDPASFTSLRIFSGAIFLLLLSLRHSGARPTGGNWWSAIVLFVYAAGFSFAYIELDTGVGALLLFGAVQVTMIGWGLTRGETLSALQWLGLLAACVGLIRLLLPGATAPPLGSAGLMLVAGLSWGVYSLLGKGVAFPAQATADNFLRASPLAAVLVLGSLPILSVDLAGAGLAMLSGAFASGAGYALWYRVLPSLQSTHAAVIQLSVPVLAALAGLMFLGEQLDLTLIIASAAILGGIALVVFGKRIP